MATDMIVGKASGGSDRFVREGRDRGGRLSTEGAGGPRGRNLHAGLHERTRARGASVELESSDTSEDGSSWMHGFDTGDMVWGKVKSHPWWPGHIFHESFASTPVRRSRREGHVLVAFFGDSSYGWFEPAELLPFEPHFAEKSKQTNSRNFLKAVEEAVDEVSRRRALGFSCLCRSPYNFRPASTPGYYAVDVIGYESGLIFSARQIKRARDSFVPVEAVTFLSKLATSPHGAGQASLEMTKMMATLLSIRKATYEEFDETYAQAFGVEPVRPPRNELGVVELPAKVAPRAAPLSGPLVFAEALGKKRGVPVRSASKAAKDQAKKNKYLFKRRDDAPPPAPDAALASPAGVIVAHGPLGAVDPPTPPPPSPPPPPAVATEAAAPAAVKYVASDSGYVLQKRHPSPGDSSGQPTPDAPLPRGPDAADDSTGGAKKPGRFLQPAVADAGSVDEAKQEERKADEASSEPATHDTKTSDGRVSPPALPSSPPIQDAVPDVRPRKPSHDATVSGYVVGEEKKKKKKRPLPPEGADTGERILKKKKTMKKLKSTVDPESGIPVRLPKQEEEAGGAAVTDSTQQTRKSPEADSPQDRKDSTDVPDIPCTAAVTAASYPAFVLPKLEVDFEDIDLRQLLPDLSALALDPFHGSERNLSVVVRHVFLLFRSLVYQKSLPLRTSEEKTNTVSEEEVQPPRSRPNSVAAVPHPSQQRPVPAGSVATAGEERERKPKLSSGRPPKPASDAPPVAPGLEDPTKAGRKRPLSDRQEERSAKKEKKRNKLKALASQKKAALKPKEEPKESGAPTSASPAVKKVAVGDSPSSVKKMQEFAPATPATPLPPPPMQPKVRSPTFLIMKFPPRSTLPSIASLKARFGRFGALDVDGCRVFWKTYTCKVLFKFKADAMVAFSHVQNNGIFGQIKVSYYLREVEQVAAPAADSPEMDKRGEVAMEVAAAPRTDAAAVQFRPGRGGSGVDSAAPPSALKKQQQVQFQPKSILKKPTVDESGPVGANGAKETPRVKFMIDVQANDNSKREPSFGGAGAAAAGGGNGGGGVNRTPLSGHDLESFNSKISRLLAPAQIPPPPPPPSVPSPRTSEAYYCPPSIPLPPQNISQPPLTTFGKSQPAPHHTVGSSHPGADGVAQRNAADISGEMLRLLLKCSDIVSNVQSTLGYPAYRPL